MPFDFEDLFDRADGHNFLAGDVVPGPWDTEASGAGGTGTIVSEVATFVLTATQAWALAESSLAAVDERWGRMRMRWDAKTNPAAEAYYVLALRAGAETHALVCMRAPTGEAMHWQMQYRSDAGLTAVATIAGIPDPVAGRFYTVEVGRKHASAGGANDGEFHILIGGAPVYSKTDIDDDTLAGMDTFRVSAGCGTAGTISGRFDDVVCDTSRIYPVLPDVRRRRSVNSRLIWRD